MSGNDKADDLTYADVYPDATPFTEPTHKLFVHIENTRCFVCDGITRFLDYSTGKPIGICSDTCFVALPEARRRRRRRARRN